MVQYNMIFIQECRDSGIKSEFVFIKGTSYLTLTGKLWGVYCQDFLANWQCYDAAILCKKIIFVWGHICKCRMFFSPVSSYLLPLPLLCCTQNSTGTLCNIKTVFPHIDIAVIKIRQSWDCCIFIMGMLILVRKHLILRQLADRWLSARLQ